MANELQLYTTTYSGSTVTAKIFNVGVQVSGTISMAEADAGNFIGDMPSVTAGEYAVNFYISSTIIAQDIIYWDGGNEVDLITIQADLDNPDQYKADVSGIALAGEYDATLSGIQFEVAGLNGEQMRGTDGAYTETPPTVGEIDVQLTASHGDGSWLSGTTTSGEYNDRLEAIQLDLDTPDQYKADVSEESLSKLIKQIRQCNMSTENVLATSDILDRNVEAGKTNYIIIKIKEDTDIDWSSPVKEVNIYAWYTALGDNQPYYMGEEN